jgi:hypothetical protein
VTVSGGKSKGLLQSKLIGPDWLTRGAFGAEASAVALAICLTMGIILLVLVVKRGHVVAPSWRVRISS